MTQQQIKNIVFIVLACIIFFLDITLFAYLQKHQILLLHSYIIVLMSFQFQKRIIFPALFLLCLLSYLDDGMFGACLLYMIPSLWLAHILHQHLRIKIIIPYLLLLASLALKISIMHFVYAITFTTNSLVQLIIYNNVCVAIITLLFFTFSNSTFTTDDN